MELPTVEIVNPNAKSGFTRINETDFNPDVHTLYGLNVGHEAGKGGPVAIPADWESLHHKTRVALAEDIAGIAIEAADGKTKTQVADEIIAAEVEKRKAA